MKINDFKENKETKAKYLKVNKIVDENLFD